MFVIREVGSRKRRGGIQAHESKSITWFAVYLFSPLSLSLSLSLYEEGGLMVAGLSRYLAGHKFKSVSLGYYHSFGVDNGGVVFAWGGGAHGRLGLGNNIADRLVPTEVKALRWIVCNTTALLTPLTHSLIRSSLFSSPSSIAKILDVTVTSSVTISHISCGAFHTAAVTSNGERIHLSNKLV